MSHSPDQKAHYEHQGYAVFRNLIPAPVIDALLSSYQKEILPSSRPYYRQSSSRYEKNLFSPQGYVRQSFLDIHAYRAHPEFSALSMEVFCHSRILAALTELTGSAKHHLMQTMLFDANTETPPHQDWWYLDSVPNGQLLAVWIAMEDIEEKAGRFYVLPGTHKVDLHSDTPGLPHSQWMGRIKNYVNEHSAEILAPALKKGDALFWNSRTIHGALPTQDPSFSRKSLTAHYLPSELAFGNLWTRKEWVRYEEFRGIRYFRNQPDYSYREHLLATFKNKIYDSPRLMRFIRPIQTAVKQIRHGN